MWFTPQPCQEGTKYWFFLNVNKVYHANLQSANFVAWGTYYFKDNLLVHDRVNVFIDSTVLTTHTFPDSLIMIYHDLSWLLKFNGKKYSIYEVKYIQITPQSIKHVQLHCGSMNSQVFQKEEMGEE